LPIFSAARACALVSSRGSGFCYTLGMNLQFQIPTELEAVLSEIAAREKRDVNDVIQDALQRFALEHSKPVPSWVGIAEGASDLSVRVNELLFQDGLRP
jgi:hypothetical protein